MRRNDITPEILKELYYKKYLSQKEVASVLKCNLTTIHKRMLKFGIPKRAQAESVRIAMRNKTITIPKSKLENLYLRKQLSIKEIATQLNYDRSIISRELKKHKIATRSRSATIRIVKDKKRIKKSLLIQLYWKKNLTPKQIGTKLSKHPETIRRLMREYNIRRRLPSEIMTRYPKFNFSGDLKERAYLIGFRIGDLHIQLSRSKNLIFADCTSTKTEQLKLFKDLFSKYGYVWVGKPRKNGNRVFLVRLNRSFNFLLPKKDNIPRWIRENNNYFLSFLAGYTDAEGCFRIGYKNVASFTLSSYEKTILKQIYQGLLKIGTECNPPRLHVKKGHKKADGCVYRNDEWSLVMNKKSSLLQVLELIIPILKHQKRLKDAKQAKQNIIQRNQKILLRKSFS